MEEILQFLMQWMNPEYLIQRGGLLLLFLVVFAENGLFFGFFLPGDSLLFMAGMLCGLPVLDVSVYMLILTIMLAAIVGYILSYFVGYRFGSWLLRQPDSFFFKKEYLNMAASYFEQGHERAMVIARFVPVIRTFLPLCLGICKSPFGSFMLYNLLGSLVWTVSLVLSGFLLKTIFPGIIDYLGYIVGIIVVLAFLPLIRQGLKYRKISGEKR